MAVEAKIAPNSEPTDSVLGVWADGREHIVAEVTVGDWENTQASLANDKQRGKTGALWRGQTSEGNKSYIAPRKNRNQTLAVLIGSGKQ
eukprot:14265295-Alexandrium_andersonii.AAC.1